MRSCFLLLLPACAAQGQKLIAPPCVVERDGILVRAEYVEEAERLVGDFAELDRRVRDLLGVQDPPTPEVWLLEVELEGSTTGTCIWVPPAVCLEKGQHENRQAVVHELAHHYLRRWPARLPAVVDEGFADLLGGMARDQLGEVRDRYAYVLRRTRVTSIHHVLELSSQEFREISDPRGTVAIRSVGFALADRIGVEGLRQMCQRAKALDLEQVPEEWLEPTWAEVASRSFQQKEIPPGLEVVTLL